MKSSLDKFFKRMHQNTSRRFVRGFFVCVILCLFPVSTIAVLSYETELVFSQQPLGVKGGWEQVDSGVTQNLRNVFFICLNRGTIVGDQGVILRSGDGGNTWVAQDSGVLENLYGVSYYGYSDTLVVGSGGTILYTSNSGTNWTILQTGMMGTYYSCQMVNETVGVAVGVNAIFQPFFTRTDNGWSSWDSMSFYIEHEGVFYEGKLTDVWFTSPLVGFATAIVDIPAGGAIVRTTDGGFSWETVLFSPEALTGIDFVNDSVAYAVGDHGMVVQTVDAGTSWQQITCGVETWLRAVDFSDEMTGTLVGDGGMIIRTETGGGSWIPQSNGTPGDLLGIQFVTEKFGIIVGSQGTILRTQTAGYPEDVTPPQTTCVLQGTLVDDVYVSDVEVTLSATDDITGVESTMYQLDDGPWETYVEPILVTLDGLHMLRYYSMDYAGNIETENTTEFSIQHAPDLEISISGGFGIKIKVSNLGLTNLSDEPWNLSVLGGLLFFGRHSTGELDINASEEVTLNAFVFGVGKTTITFSIASQEKTVQATIFLFFVRT